GDKRARNVDLFAIIKGAQYAFRVALAQEDGKDVKFVVPHDHENQFVVGIVPKPDFCFDFLELDAETIGKHGVRKGGYIEVRASRKRDDYVSDGDVWRRISTFSERL